MDHFTLLLPFSLVFSFIFYCSAQIDPCFIPWKENGYITLLNGTHLPYYTPVEVNTVIVLTCIGGFQRFDAGRSFCTAVNGTFYPAVGYCSENGQFPPTEGITFNPETHQGYTPFPWPFRTTLFPPTTTRKPDRNQVEEVLVTFAIMFLCVVITFLSLTYLTSCYTQYLTCCRM